MSHLSSDQPASTVQGTGSKGLAITSLCLGAGGLVLCLLGPVAALIGIGAVATGAIALTRRQAGRGMAIGGLACGVLAILLGAGMTFAYFGALGQARKVARMTQSLAKSHEIGMALSMYATDNKDALPEAGADLRTRLAKYCEPKAFESPYGLSVDPAFIYVPHGRITRLTASDVVMYENPSAPALAYAVLYGDMHVEGVKKDEFEAFVARIKQPAGR